MACSMVKKGLAAAALTAGALYVAFGTSAPSYVCTAFHKVRGHAQAAVPVQFEIDRAREEVQRLEKPIRETMATYFNTQVEAEYLETEIAMTRTNLEREQKRIVALKDRVKTGDVKQTGNTTYSDAEVRTELTRKYDNYRAGTKILSQKESTLKSKRKIMDAARQQLSNLQAQRRELLTRLEGIEARLQQIQTAKQSNEFNFDDSALSQAKKDVTDLEKRVEVQARISEVEGNFADSLPLLTEPGRDVVKEIEDEFGSGAKTDKSL